MEAKFRVRTAGGRLSGRRLVIVDAENAALGAFTDIATGTSVRMAVSAAIGMGPCDQVVIGVSHRSVVAAGSGWRGARIVVRSGLNGADLALMEVLEEDVARRYDEVVVVSGDGIFAPTVSRLRAQGVTVTVVGHRRRMSSRLAQVASRVVYLAPAAGTGGANMPFQGPV